MYLKNAILAAALTLFPLQLDAKAPDLDKEPKLLIVKHCDKAVLYFGEYGDTYVLTTPQFLANNRKDSRARFIFWVILNVSKKNFTVLKVEQVTGKKCPINV